MVVIGGRCGVWVWGLVVIGMWSVGRGGDRWEMWSMGVGFSGDRNVEF